MLEVGEDVAARSQMFGDAGNHAAALLFRVIRLAESVVNEGRGGNIRRGTFFSLRHAECGSVRFQQFPSRVSKPGVVTEFKCRRQRPRQKREKVLEQRRVRFQIWRQLEERRPQLSSAGQRLNRRQKARNKILRALQPLDVRDDLVRLDAKTKVRGRFLYPVLDCGLFHQLPESKVHLDRIELRSVVAEKLFLREFGGIEVGLPCWISPP